MGNCESGEESPDEIPSPEPGEPLRSYVARLTREKHESGQRQRDADRAAKALLGSENSTESPDHDHVEHKTTKKKKKNRVKRLQRRLRKRWFQTKANGEEDSDDGRHASTSQTADLTGYLTVKEEAEHRTVRRFECGLCWKHMFHTKAECLAHLAEDHSNISYMCSKCNKVFDNNTDPHDCGAGKADYTHFDLSTGQSGSFAKKALDDYMDFAESEYCKEVKTKRRTKRSKQKTLLDVTMEIDPPSTASYSPASDSRLNSDSASPIPISVNSPSTSKARFATVPLVEVSQSPCNGKEGVALDKTSTRPSNVEPESVSGQRATPIAAGPSSEDEVTVAQLICAVAALIRVRVQRFRKGFMKRLRRITARLRRIDRVRRITDSLRRIVAVVRRAIPGLSRKNRSKVGGHDHSEISHYDCGICWNVKFPTKEECLTHLETCHSNIFYMCSTCKKLFPSNTDPHDCEVGPDDYVRYNKSTGEKGPEAEKTLAAYMEFAETEYCVPIKKDKQKKNATMTIIIDSPSSTSQTTVKAEEETGECKATEVETPEKAGWGEHRNAAIKEQKHEANTTAQPADVSKRDEHKTPSAQPNPEQHKIDEQCRPAAKHVQWSNKDEDTGIKGTNQDIEIKANEIPKQEVIKTEPRANNVFRPQARPARCGVFTGVQAPKKANAVNVIKGTAQTKHSLETILSEPEIALDKPPRTNSFASIPEVPVHCMSVQKKANSGGVAAFKYPDQESPIAAIVKEQGNTLAKPPQSHDIGHSTRAPFSRKTSNESVLESIPSRSKINEKPTIQSKLSKATAASLTTSGFSGPVKKVGSVSVTKGKSPPMAGAIAKVQKAPNASKQGRESGTNQQNTRKANEVKLANGTGQVSGRRVPVASNIKETNRPSTSTCVQEIEPCKSTSLLSHVTDKGAGTKKYKVGKWVSERNETDLWREGNTIWKKVTVIRKFESLTDDEGSGYESEEEDENHT